VRDLPARGTESTRALWTTAAQSTTSQELPQVLVLKLSCDASVLTPKFYGVLSPRSVGTPVELFRRSCAKNGVFPLPRPPRLAAPSVSVGPGLTELTRIFFFPSSLASTPVIVSTEGASVVVHYASTIAGAGSKAVAVKGDVSKAAEARDYERCNCGLRASRRPSQQRWCLRFCSLEGRSRKAIFTGCSIPMCLGFSSRVWAASFRTRRLFRSDAGNRYVLETSTSSSIARRPDVRTPVPDVTIKGRSEPTRAEPRASLACLPVSQLALDFEKSRTKVVSSRCSA
jgi:hypothetical protein